MAPLQAGDVEAALVAKGMTRDESHHHMFKKDVAGVTTLVTRTSHSGAQIGDDLAKRMANQCCLQLREFKELVDCSLTESQWDTLVSQRCVGGRNPFFGR
jgi:hypothetical protein